MGFELKLEQTAQEYLWQRETWTKYKLLNLSSTDKSDQFKGL